MGKAMSALRLKPAAVSGFWFDYEEPTGDPLAAAHPDHTCFLVARFNNRSYREKFHRLLAQRAPMLPRASDLPESRAARQVAYESMARAVTAESMVGTVLLGWSNLLGDDKQQLQFTDAAAITILSDPAFDEVANFIIELARGVDGIWQEATEAAAGN